MELMVFIQDMQTVGFYYISIVCASDCAVRDKSHAPFILVLSVTKVKIHMRHKGS